MVKRSLGMSRSSGSDVPPPLNQVSLGTGKELVSVQDKLKLFPITILSWSLLRQSLQLDSNSIEGIAKIKGIKSLYYCNL